MDVNQQIARVRVDGEALALAAEAGPLDAAVPGCPGWDVEMLLRHIGGVHRWAATIVRERLSARPPRDQEGPYAPAALLAWYREGHDALIEALKAASSDDSFWFWGPAPNALAFWARRQANETAVHRCDAESARGPITALIATDAHDGLDEWLGLAALFSSAADGGGRILRLVTTDSNAAWSLVLGERIEVAHDTPKSDCELQGAASDVFLWAMNRRGTQGLGVSGDSGLLQVWADNVRF